MWILFYVAVCIGAYRWAARNNMPDVVDVGMFQALAMVGMAVTFGLGYGFKTLLLYLF